MLFSCMGSAGFRMKNQNQIPDSSLALNGDKKYTGIQVRSPELTFLPSLHNTVGFLLSLKQVFVNESLR